MTQDTDTDFRMNDARVRHWPDLAYWFNLDFDQLLKMPRNVRRVYEMAIPRVRADAKSMMMDASSFPHMEDEGRKKMIDAVQREQNFGAPEPEAPMFRPEDAVAAGIEVVLVDKDGNPVEPTPPSEVVAD